MSEENQRINICTDPKRVPTAKEVLESVERVKDLFPSRLKDGAIVCLRHLWPLLTISTIVGEENLNRLSGIPVYLVCTREEGAELAAKLHAEGKEVFVIEDKP